MTAEAALYSGDHIHYIDYTPSSGNVTAGTVILYGNTAGLTCIIPHVDLTNNVKGACAAGGGIYAVTNLNNSANGAKVYWDDTNNKVTSVSTNNALFGFVASGGGGGANTTCYVLHKPYV